jgi:hypothetical protein
MLPLSVVLSLLLAGTTLYNILAIDRLASVLTIFCVWPLFAVVSIASLIYVPLQLNKGNRRAALPLLVNLIAALMTYGILQVSWSTDVKFDVHIAGFTEVLGLIEAGTIQPNDHDHAKLPDQYKYLSEGGTIRVHQESGVTSVLFYGGQGILGEFWGYVYRSDNSPPERFLWCDEWSPLRQSRSNWFMCDSY